MVFCGGLVIEFSKRMIVAVAVAIVIVSVSSTFALTRWLTSTDEAVPATGNHQNITFTDAVLACRSQATAKLPAGLLTLTLDDHSSRFEQGERLYKIFLQAQVRKSPDDFETIGVAVYCFVKADQGFVSYYEQLEQTNEDGAPALNKPGGVFGWPI